MKIKFVVLLCSIAGALASPTGEQFLDTLMDELVDEALYESDANQGQSNAPMKSFNDYLARFMQCTPARGCHMPPNEAICGTDDRHIITDPDVTIPYRWICRIVVTLSTGRVHTGSAFKVKISPDVGRTVLFTAAHVLREKSGSSGRYAPHVRIQCPGEPEVIVRRTSNRDMWMAQPHLVFENWSYDYGYITYPGDSNTGFGFQGFFDRAALARTPLHSCGFPTEQNNCISQCALAVSPPAVPLPYCDSGLYTRVLEDKLHVDADIDEGESGGPLFSSTGNNYIVYGIVSLGSDGCPQGRNYQRLTGEALYEMFSEIGGVDMNYRIWSTHNTYLHMNGAAPPSVSHANPIGGRVYLGPLDDYYARLLIFPIKQSSSNQPDSQLVVIRSVIDDVYLHLNGSGVDGFELHGHSHGIVNCRYKIDDGAMETFYKEIEPNGEVAFRSSTFDNVYLRLDHWNTKVDAQFGKFSLETHHLERWP